MNREQFLKILEHIATEECTPLGKQVASRAGLVRATEKSLTPWRAMISKPQFPLPSAETIAAFIDNRSDDLENLQIISAAVHDTGILLQVILALEEHSIPVPSYPRDPLLHQRLLALKKTSTVPPIAPPMETKNGRRSIHAFHPFAWSALAATVALSIGGTALYYTIMQGPHDDRVVDVETKKSQETIVDPSESPNEPREEKGNDAGPQLAQGGSDRNTNDSTLLQQEKETSPEYRRGPELTQRPTLPQESSREHEDSPPKPQLISPPKSIAMDLEWTQIQGLLLERDRSTVDGWMVRSQGNRETKGNDKDPTAASAVSTWLTPEGCYARGQFGGQVEETSELVASELVVGANSCLRTWTDGQKMVLELQDGAIAIKNLPSGQNIELRLTSEDSSEESANHIHLKMKGATTLFARVEEGCLRVQILEGAIESEVPDFAASKGFRVVENQTEVDPTPFQEPAWVSKLPTETILNRTILANLDGAVDIRESLDKALIKLAAMNGPKPTPTGLRNLELLSRWRASLEVDQPLAAMGHPLWLVRKGILDRVTGESQERWTRQARRLLLARLPVDRADRYSRWLSLVQATSQPTRADLGDWLAMVIDQDPAVASLGDYFLRRRFGRGPDFNPSGSSEHKRQAKQQWTAMIAR